MTGGGKETDAGQIHPYLRPKDIIARNFALLEFSPGLGSEFPTRTSRKLLQGQYLRLSESLASLSPASLAFQPGMKWFWERRQQDKISEGRRFFISFLSLMTCLLRAIPVQKRNPFSVREVCCRKDLSKACCLHSTLFNIQPRLPSPLGQSQTQSLPEALNSSQLSLSFQLHFP